MKLVVIYGPPAVGKLTVAEALASLTGVKVFHNHLTVDLVESVFERGTLSFSKLIWDIRYAAFEEAARVNINGLIFTMVYGRNREQAMAGCVEAVEKHGGEVYFVHLYCSQHTLEMRVFSEERKRFGKVTSVEQLNNALDRLQGQTPFASASRWDSISIDTDALCPQKAAQAIKAHYNFST